MNLFIFHSNTVAFCKSNLRILILGLSYFSQVLVNTDLFDPRSIAVSPDEGLMFWSDWYERSPKVERAALDGSDRSILVKDGLGWPNGITLDIPRRRLYWLVFFF